VRHNRRCSRRRSMERAEALGSLVSTARAYVIHRSRTPSVMPRSLSRCVREVYRCAAGLACLATFVALPGLASAQDEALRPALLPFAGYGTYPREPVLGQAQATASRHLVGLAFDWPAGQRVLVTTSVARTIQLFGCSLCEATGSMVGAAVQALVTSTGAKWGVLVGPQVEYTTLGNGRVGGGAAVTVGGTRGVAPRLTFRRSFLTGPHPSSHSVLVSVRLGR